MTRPPEDYLRLRYSGLGDRPEFLELIVRSKGKLEDKPIIGTGEEFCNANLGDLLRRKKLRRLLLTIEQGLAPEHLRCLESLGAGSLYLSLCPQPRRNNYRTCSGEEDLRVLRGAAPTFLARVRGIAVGLEQPASWQEFRAFRELRYLTVRGPAATNQDPAALLDLCARPSLLHLDMLDAENAGSTVLDVPHACGLLRQSFDYWSPPEPVRGEPCHLRRLFVWNLNENQQAALESACPKLHAIDIVAARKRIRK